MAKYLLQGWGFPYFVYDTEGEFPRAVSRLAAVDWRQKAIAYDPFQEGRADKEAQFAHVCNVVFARGRRVFTVPEVMDYVGVNSIPDNLLTLIRRGRHRHVGALLLAQDFVGMAPLIRQCQHLIVFSVCGSALDQVDAYMPATDGMKPSELMQRLRPYQYLYWPRSDPVRRNRCQIHGPEPIRGI